MHAWLQAHTMSIAAFIVIGRVALLLSVPNAVAIAWRNALHNQIRTSTNFQESLDSHHQLRLLR